MKSVSEPLRTKLTALEKEKKLVMTGRFRLIYVD